jgi:hypothetical protein
MAKRNNCGGIMYIYSIGNINGFYNLFEEALSLIDLSGDNKLVLLGDYYSVGPDSYKILDRIMALEKEYGNQKVIVLRGRQEKWVLEHIYIIDDIEMHDWEGIMRQLAYMKNLADLYKNGTKDEIEKLRKSFYDDQKKYSVYLHWFKTLRHLYKNGNYVFYNKGLADEAEKSLKTLYCKQIDKDFNKKDYNNWIGSLFTVTTSRAIRGHEYKDYLKDAVNEYGYVHQKWEVELVEPQFKSPKVIKIDPTNESGEHLRYEKNSKGDYTQRESDFIKLTFTEIGRNDLIYSL